MDLCIKIYGVMYTIVLTVKLIHGRDDLILNVAQQGSKNEDPETQRQLKQVPDKTGKVKVEMTTYLSNKKQPGLLSPIEEQLKWVRGYKTGNEEQKQDQEQFKQVPDSKLNHGTWTPRPPGVSETLLPPWPGWQGQKELKQVPDKTVKFGWKWPRPNREMIPLGSPQLKQVPDKTVKLKDEIPKELLNMEQSAPPPPGHWLLELVSLVPQHGDSPYSTTFTVEWPYGIVPYYIDKDTNDENLKRCIQKAMAIVEASSCVIFKERTEKPQGDETTSWLHFTNPDQQRECSHDTIQGDNKDIIIVLGIECLKTRDILHSVLHGLGFKDEVSHPHRDQYIRIQWENVQPSYRPLFRVRLDKAPYKLVEYDPMSIMHFHDRAYSDNGALTIVPVMPGLVINPSDKLSQLDVMKLRIMFGHECNKRKVDSLIDNCKNVLYKKKHTKDPQINLNVDTQEPNAEVDDNNQQLITKDDDKQQLNLDEDDDKHETNAEKDDDDQQLKAKTNGTKQLKALNKKHGYNKQQLDANIEYLPLKGEHNHISVHKHEIDSGVREGRRDYPLHLWKYNTERLH